MSADNVNVNLPPVEYRKDPPEGGWGYMVAVGQAITFFVILGPLQCFGLIYADFFQSIGGKTSNITMCVSAFFTSYSLTGLLANALFKKFSCRQVGLAGAILYTTGSFLTVFVTSLGQMLFTYSLLEGIGYGLMVPATLTGFNTYFVERRSLIYLATKPVIGVMTMCFPLVIYALMEQFGFRGMLAILTAINSHSILAMVLLQPVERHLKLVPVDTEMETVSPNSDEKPKEENTLLKRKEMTKVASSARLQKSESQLQIRQPHLSSILDISELDKISCARSTGRNNSILSRRSGSMAAGGATEKDVAEVRNKNRSFVQKIVDFFDLTLLKDFTYVNLWIGVAFSEFSSLTFVTLLPVHLGALGFSKGEIAMCLFSGGIADLSARIVLLITGPLFKIKSRHNYLAAAACSVIARYVFLSKTELTPLMFTIAAVIFFRTCMVVSIALVFAEYSAPERFPAAYGLYMFLQGSISLMLGPLIGYIRDVTGSYIICFQALLICLLICVIPWSLQLVWTKIRGNRNEN